MTSIGTRLFTLLRGQLIGRDEDGRAYYQERAPGGYTKRRRRWVLYNRGEDASSVPAEWWNWLHHVDDAPLPPAARRPWQLPFLPNRTGEADGYHPQGSDYRGGLRTSATGDYESWTPDA